MPAKAHDDPVLTVKLLCAGLTAQDRGAVLLELDQTASVQVDRPVRGKQQVQDWLDEQFAHNLHCELGEIQEPELLSTGNAITWTATYTRDDWGTPGRVLKQHLVIQNARITEWAPTPLTGADAPTAGSLRQPVGLRRVLQAGEGAEGSPQKVDPAPEAGPLGVPPTLIAAIVVGLLGLAYAAHEVVASRSTQRQPPGPTIPRL